MPEEPLRGGGGVAKCKAKPEEPLRGGGAGAECEAIPEEPLLGGGVAAKCEAKPEELLRGGGAAKWGRWGRAGGDRDAGGRMRVPARLPLPH